MATALTAYLPLRLVPTRMAALLPSSLPSLSSSAAASPSPGRPLLLLPFLFRPTLSFASLSAAARVRRPSSVSARAGEGRDPRIPDEWGDKSEPEAGLSSAPDPPVDEDEWGAEPGPPKAVAVATTDEWGDKSEPEAERSYAPDPPVDEDEWGAEPGPPKAAAVGTTDEWGEKAEPEVEAPYPADPSRDDDEWGAEAGFLSGNGTPVLEDDKLGDLKRCLVDSLYGMELGLRATLEDRAEILELVNQLEAANPTKASTEAPELLDGNWILLYTAFSELLPLLAVGATPLLKVKKISQVIDSKTLEIVNATTLSSPFATFSFSATASFEVQTSSRIQVQFKEGVFQPPEISSSLDLPETVDIFGQKIDLKPVQQALNPIQEAAANITRSISGQPPLKVPLPGNRAASWLLITYLDHDFRISRGDGGLFVLAKEGSPLLDLLS